MKVITLKFNDAAEWNFLLELLKRLNFRVEWTENAPASKKNNPDMVAKLFGSFPSDKSSDELVKMLYDARVNQTREITL